MLLYGDKGESGRIYLSPDGSKFEPDKFYKVSVNIKDIGNVSRFNLQTKMKTLECRLSGQIKKVNTTFSNFILIPCRSYRYKAFMHLKFLRLIEGIIKNASGTCR